MTTIEKLEDATHISRYRELFLHVRVLPEAATPSVDVAVFDNGRDIEDWTPMAQGTGHDLESALVDVLGKMGLL